MAQPTDVNLSSFLANKFYNDSPDPAFFQSEKKVHTLGLVLIALSLIALSIIIYFGSTRSFNDVRIIVPGTIALTLLVCGILLFAKKTFWKDPTYVHQRQESAITYLLENGVSKFVEKYGADATKLFTKEQILEICRRTNLGMNALEQNLLGITLVEVEQNAIINHFEPIKAKVDSVDTMGDLARVCNNFRPNHIYKGRMKAFFEFVDPCNSMRDRILEDVKDLIKQEGFEKAAKECTKLECLVEWSPLRLSKELVTEHLLSLKNFYGLEDYFPAILPCLPKEILNGINLQKPDFEMLWSNWSKFQNPSRYSVSDATGDL